MKKLLKKLLVLAFALLISISFIMPVNAGQRGKQKRQKQERYQKHDRRPNHYGQGYRYKYYGHKRRHQPKHYRGHWRSWRQWEDYRRYHRREHREGRYYRQNGSLYFEFENEDGRFVFSIGK